MNGIRTSWQGLTLLDHLPQAFVLVDGQGLILAANPLAQALFRATAEVMHGQPLKRFLPQPEGAAATPDWRPCDGGVLWAQPREGEHFPVEVLSARLEVDGAGVCALLLRDLRPERAAKARLVEWENLFQHAGWGVTLSSVATNTLELMNPAFAQMHGYSVQELRGRPLIELFVPRVRAEVLARVQRGDVAGQYRYESVHLRKDGSEFPVLIDATVVKDAAGQALYRVVNVQDISEQVRSRELLQHSEALLNLVLDHLPVGVRIADEHGRVVRTNPAWRVICRDPAAPPSGMPQLRFWRIQSEQRVGEPVPDPLVKAVQEGSATLREMMDMECADGARRTVLKSALPLRDGAGAVQGAIAVTEDITERRQAELALGESRQELRALVAYDDALLEEERKHIAREVHDELGQLLTALRMDLALLRPAVKGDAAAQGQIDKMREMIDHTLLVVRHVASNLRPAALDLGLVAALEWLTEDFSLRWEMPCELQVSGDGFQLDEAVATALFRVVQESLTNVARHANAGRVAVRLSHDAQGLALEVEDDGRGFDPLALRSRKRKGFGLLGMEERMLKIGGTLEVQSGPWGTRARFQLPLPKPSR
jgi:PAS domain S-box-containing protein